MRISDWSSDVCSSDLGHAVDRVVAQRPLRVDVGHVDDRAPRGGQVRRGGLGEEERRARVAGEQDVPLRRRHRAQRRGAEARGVVDQRVEAAEAADGLRSEEHTSELPSLMRISYAVFCLKKKKDIYKYKP